MVDARIWNKISKREPDHDEPVLCLLHNGQQVTLAFDKDKNEWIFYNGKKLIDAHVVAWKELESRDEILLTLNSEL